MSRRPAQAYAVPATPVRTRAAALAVTVLLVLTAFATGAVNAAPAGASTSVEETFTHKLNQARADAGLSELRTRRQLVRITRSWARTMADQSRLSHNPELTSDVDNWRWVGENVGYGPDALTLHVAFMNSPSHRANMLDRDYTEVGIGAVVSGGRVWVVQVFRRPLRVTTSSTTRAFAQTLRAGSRGPAVKRVQGRLSVRQTGYYNRSTKRAVARFQQRQGWTGRGNVGPKTWARLF